MWVFKILITNSFFFSQSKDFLSSNLVSGSLPHRHSYGFVRRSCRTPKNVCVGGYVSGEFKTR